MSDPITLHRVRAVCGPSESQRIIDALVAGGGVSDTRGFSTAGMRVVEFIAQHHSEGKYAALYPAPDIADDAADGEHDPFTVAGSSLVFDVWQFDYGDTVHGHIMASPPGAHPYLCVTPTRHARLAFLGTCSRRPADTFDFATSDEGDDNLTAYIFDRDNTAITGWVLAYNADIDAAVRVSLSTGPSIADPVWWDVGGTGPAPGTDIVLDACGDEPLVEAVYLATANPDYLDIW